MVDGRKTKKVKILSSQGFKNFDGFINQGISKTLICITFESGNKIKATTDHEFLSKNGMYVKAETLFVGDSLSTGEVIFDIQIIDNELVYDALNVDDVHDYYTNGVISHNCNLIYIDEAAIIPNTVADKFFASTYPVISSGESTKIIMTSTPLGLNHFWKFWSEAEQGINGFVPVRVDYWEHPKHDKKWADDQRKLLGELKFNQEILMDFVGSGATLIDGAKVASLPIKHGTIIFPNYIEYEAPKRDEFNKVTGNYVITVDTSRGSDLDYSAFTVIDINQMPYKVVARYKDNSISPLMYPEVIFKVGTRYNNAFVLIETNDLGQQVADILFYDLEYENVYMSIKDTIKEGGGNKKTPGLRTTKRTKTIGCAQLKTLIESDHLEVNDFDTISELSTFIRKGASYAADDGKHDDLTMCLVMFAYLTQENVFKELFDFSLRQEFIRNQIKEFDDYTSPIGFVDRGEPEKEFSLLGDYRLNSWVESNDEFTWF
jgi:hypothetical protein